MEDKICHIFHHGLTISNEQYLPYPEGATVALLIGKAMISFFIMPCRMVYSFRKDINIKEN